MSDGNSKARILVLAARQPELVELLEDAGFEVDVRTRPLDGEPVAAELALVFRGRLIGRNQAATLAAHGTPVIEILTVDPPSPSRAHWIRLSNRIGKNDLVQVVRAAADWARDRTRAPTPAS